MKSYLKRWSQAFDSRQNLYRLKRSAMCFHVWQLSAKKVRDRKCHSVNQIKSIMVATATATAAGDKGGSHHHHHHHALSMLHGIRRELEHIPTQPMIQPLMIVKTAILHLFRHPTASTASTASVESSVGLVTPTSLAQLVGPQLFLKQSSAVRAALGYPDTDIVNVYAGPVWRRSLFWKVALFTDTSAVGTWNDDDNFCSNLIRVCLSNKVMSESDSVVGQWKELVSVSSGLGRGENIIRDVNISVVDIDVGDSNITDTTVLNGTQAVLLVIPITVSAGNAATLIARSALQVCVDSDLPITLIVTKEASSASADYSLSVSEVSREALHDSLTGADSYQDASHATRELARVVHVLAQVLNTTVLKLAHLVSTAWVFCLQSSHNPTLSKVSNTSDCHALLATCDSCLFKALHVMSTLSSPFPLIRRMSVADMVDEASNNAIWGVDVDTDKDKDKDKEETENDVLERVVSSIDRILVNLHETITVSSGSTSFPAVEFKSINDDPFSHIEGALFEYGDGINDTNVLPLDWASPLAMHRVMDLLTSFRSQLSRSELLRNDFDDIVAWKRFIQLTVRGNLTLYFDDMVTHLIASKNGWLLDDVHRQHRQKRQHRQHKKRKEITNNTETDNEYTERSYYDDNTTQATASDTDSYSVLSTKKKKKFWHEMIDQSPGGDDDSEPLMNLFEAERRQSTRLIETLSLEEQDVSAVEQQLLLEQRSAPNRIGNKVPADMHGFLSTMRQEREVFDCFYL